MTLPVPHSPSTETHHKLPPPKILNLQKYPISCKVFKARGEVIVDHFALIRDGLSQAINQRSRHL